MIDLRKNLIERRFVELTPDLARHYLTFNTYHAQRAIRQLHVEELANKMRDGLFRFGEVAFVSYNGTRDIMTNGQHCCCSVIESGVTVPCVFERFRVDSELELSEVFRQFEILPRSLKDMVRVEANALNLTWPNFVSHLLVATAAIEKSEQKMVMCKWMSKDDKVRLLGKYLKEGAFLCDIFTVNGSLKGGDNARHLRRRAVALIMIQTWRISAADAYVFWERIRDGENLTKEMPEMKLREFLLQTRSIICPSVYAARRVTDHEYAYRCALAWNAFRTKGSTNLAYRPEKPVPKLR